MKHLTILVAGLALLTAAFSVGAGARTTTIGGSVSLDVAAAGETAFYDARTELALIDARQLESSPLDDFVPTATPASVVAGSVEPIGQFSAPRVDTLPEVGPLRVGRWHAVEENGTEVSCFGFYNGDGGSGSRCLTTADAPPQTAEVFWELTCQAGERDRWIAFTIDSDAVALRFDFRDDVSVVGSDPAGTGLVAVEGVGTLTRALAQTRAGQVFSVDIAGADCQTG